MTSFSFTHNQASREHAERRTHQSHLAGRIGLVLLWVMLLALGLAGVRRAPPQHLPWTRLTITDPVGLFTREKLAHTEGLACRSVLARGGITYLDQPDKLAGGYCAQADAVKLDGGTAPLSPAGVAMTCRETAAFAVWERQVVQTAANKELGQGVVGIDHYGAYACRHQYGDPALPVSEHARANALDIAGFTLTDGSHVTVARDWKDPGAAGRFLHEVRDGACGVFSVTLSPDFNARHADHLHLDMGASKGCS